VRQAVGRALYTQFYFANESLCLCHPIHGLRHYVFFVSICLCLRAYMCALVKAFPVWLAILVSFLILLRVFLDASSVVVGQQG